MSTQPTPENAPKTVPETPAVNAPEQPPTAMSGTPPKAVSAAPPKATQPARPTPQPINVEVAEIIREKFSEAGKQLQPAISVEVIAKVAEVEAKRRTTAIMQDAIKYARNRAKSEKITPRILAEAVLDHLGIKRESGRADKSAKKSPPSSDQKGGDHGSK